MGFPRQEYWSGLPFSFSRGSSWSKDSTCVSCIVSGFFTTEACTAFSKFCIPVPIFKTCYAKISIEFENMDFGVKEIKWCPESLMPHTQSFLTLAKWFSLFKLHFFIWKRGHKTSSNNMMKALYIVWKEIYKPIYIFSLYTHTLVSPQSCSRAENLKLWSYTFGRSQDFLGHTRGKNCFCKYTQTLFTIFSVQTVAPLTQK